MSGDGSDDAKKKRAAFRTRPGRDGEYEVGYGKPPKETRFRKGQSGNPKGRPKGAKTGPPDHDRLAAILLEEAYREVPLREGGREMTVPMVVAVVRGQFVSGARGSPRSAQLALEMLRGVEDRERQKHDEFRETAIAYKTEWEAEIERCRKEGLPEPDLCPHPDQIHINVATGEVHFTGPLTKEDRKLIEDFRKRKVECEAEIHRLRLKHKRARKPENKKLIREEIEQQERMLKVIRSRLREEGPIEAFQRDVERRFSTEG